MADYFTTNFGINTTPIKGVGGEIGFYGTTNGSNGRGENGVLANGSFTTGFGGGIEVMVNMLEGGIENIQGRSTTDQICLLVCFSLHKDLDGNVIGGGVGIGLVAGFTHYENNTITYSPGGK